MIKVTFEAQVPSEKMLFWLFDWLITFDRAHPGCVFRMLAEGGDQKVSDMWKMFEQLGLDVKFVDRNTGEPHGTTEGIKEQDGQTQVHSTQAPGTRTRQ